MPGVDVADIELKFIKACLSSKRAFRTAQGTINGYNFTHPYLTWLWTEINNYDQKHKHKPGVELVELLMDNVDDGLAPKARMYQEALDGVDYNTEDIEFYVEQLIKRCKLQQQLKAITSAQNALEIGDTEASERCLATASTIQPGIKPKTQAGLGFRVQEASYYPTGLSALDYHIDGLGRGEVGVVMGVTGVGKSILATNFVYGLLKARWQKANNLRRVWHIDTENGERIVKCRHISRITGLPSRALEKDMLTTQQTARMEAWLERNNERLSEQLFIYPAEFLGTSLHDIERELMYLENDDHMPDVIVFDSPDHLTSDSKGEQARWERFAEIYFNLRAFAKRYNVAIWTFTQAQLQYENRVATNAAVADSKEKARLAHIVLSINVNKTDPNQRFIYIAKNRTGSCRFQIALDIEWERMRVSTAGENVPRPDRLEEPQDVN